MSNIERQENEIQFLKDELEKYKDYYENSADMHVSVDPIHATVKECSQSLVEKLNYYSKEEIIGKSLDEIYHPSCHQKYKEAFKIFKAEGFVKNFELSLKTKKGEEIPVLLNVTAVRDDTGKILRSRSTWTDISDLKESEKKLQEANWLTNIMSELNTDGWWDWDLNSPNMEDEYMSPGLKRLFGYEDHEVPNKSWWWQEHIYPEDKDKAFEAFKDHIENGTTYNLPVRYKCKDGSTKWVICRGFAIKDEKGIPIRMVGTHTDITELMEVKESLKRSNTELERFAYIVAHDLQSPIRHVIGYTSTLIATDKKSSLSEEIVDKLNKIDISARKMQKMLDALLSYSRLEKSDIVFETLDMNQIFSAAMTLFNREIRKKEIDVVLEDLMPARGSLSLIEQVAQNLIGNAIKYGPNENKQIKISSIEKNDHIVFSIEDNGIGFDQKHAEKIFDIFKRIHKDIGVEGTGIGLAICKSIIERHGGEIWARSTEGSGSTFSFSLPK